MNRVQVIIKPDTGIYYSYEKHTRESGINWKLIGERILKEQYSAGIKFTREYLSKIKSGSAAYTKWLKKI